MRKGIGFGLSIAIIFLYVWNETQPKNHVTNTVVNLPITTVAKAKELRPFVERLVSAGKQDSVASRRLIASRLGGAPEVVSKLNGALRVRYAKRAGGYTRIILLGKIGKQATESARIEFVK